MAKIYNYMILMTTLVIIFNLATGGTGTFGMISNFGAGNVGQLAGFNSLAIIVGLLAAIAVIGLGLRISMGGIVSQQTTIETVKAGTGIGVLLIFIMDLVNVVNMVNAQSRWVGYVIYIIVAPLVYSYIFALMDWIGGTD